MTRLNDSDCIEQTRWKFKKASTTPHTNGHSGKRRTHRGRPRHKSVRMQCCGGLDVPAFTRSAQLAGGTHGCRTPPPRRGNGCSSHLGGQRAPDGVPITLAFTHGARARALVPPIATGAQRWAPRKSGFRTACPRKPAAHVRGCAAVRGCQGCT